MLCPQSEIDVSYWCPASGGPSFQILAFQRAHQLIDADLGLATRIAGSRRKNSKARQLEIFASRPHKASSPDAFSSFSTAIQISECVSSLLKGHCSAKTLQPRKRICLGYRNGQC
jgi:hypothetical protein